MGKDKDNIWEWMGYRDHDFDGDVDLRDVLIEDDELMELQKKLHPDYEPMFDDDEDDDTGCDEEDEDADNDDGDDNYECDEHLQQKTQQLKRRHKQSIIGVVATAKKLEGEEAWMFYWDVRKGKWADLHKVMGKENYCEIIKDLEEKLSLNDKKYPTDYPDKTSYREHLEMKLDANKKSQHDSLSRMSETELLTLRRSILENQLDIDEDYCEPDGATDKIKSSIKSELLEAVESRLFAKEPFLKYYDERYNNWDLKQALFDKFPELQKSRNSNSDFEFLVGNYEFNKDPQKALSYLDYLLNNFPFEKAQEPHECKCDEVSDLIIKMVYWMECSDNEKHIEHLYSYLNNNEKYFEALFVRYKWNDWDEVYPDIYAYFRPFVYKSNYQWLVKAHNAMLKHHGNAYTKEIQDEFWESMISCEESNEQRRQGQHGFYWGVPIPDDAYEFFMGVVETLECSTKSREKLKQYAPEDSLDSIENEIEELEFEIEGLLYKKEQLLKKLNKRSKANG